MTQQATSLALTAGWTDAPVTITNAGNASVFQNQLAADYGYSLNGYWYPYYVPWTPPVYTPTVHVWPTVTCSHDPKPIKLTMAEVERLRVAAKRDKALKATLEKFTEHIEVIVDFGKKED